MNRDVALIFRDNVRETFCNPSGNEEGTPGPKVPHR